MAVVEWEKKDAVAIVSMCNTANKMNNIFAQDLNLCLDQVQADAQVKAMILTSTDEKNFSQGIDVQWLGQKLEDGETQAIIDFMYAMNEIFKRLLQYPMPVIAAINGHAFGNGAILSCACDFRFMRQDKGFFCFPEVDISIPFLPGMIAFVRKAIPEYMFNHMLLSGQRMTAQQLEAGHVIVKACEDQQDLMSKAMAFAQSFDKKRGIFKELKKRIHKAQIKVIDEQDPQFIDAMNLFVSE